MGQYIEILSWCLNEWYVSNLAILIVSNQKAVLVEFLARLDISSNYFGVDSTVNNFD